MSRFFRRGEGGSGASTPGASAASSVRNYASPSSSSLASTPATTTDSPSSLLGSPTSHLITRPHPSVTISPLPAPTEEEKPVLARLREHVERLIHSHYYNTDGSPRQAGSMDEEGKPVEPYYEKWERRWLDYEPEDWTVRRYLKASANKEPEAKRRLAHSLAWRRKMKPDLILPSYVKIEGETGKHLLSGFDDEGRPLLHLMPGKENTKPSPRQIAYLIWGLERACDFLPPGQTKIALVIDFHQASAGESPGLATQKEVLAIVQDHYPERLGRAFVMRPPLWMGALYKALGPFIDSATRAKIKWNLPAKELQGFIPSEQLLRDYGGRYNFTFEKEAFWDEVLDFTGVDAEGGRKWASLAKCESGNEEQWKKEGRGSLAGKPAEGSEGSEGNGGHDGLMSGKGPANGTEHDDVTDDDDDDDDDDDFTDVQDDLATIATTATSATTTTATAQPQA